METTTFAGWPDCVRLSNGSAEVIVTTVFGPRIIRYGLIDGPNAFQVISDTQGKIGKPGDDWQPYGGHRLWHAPEVKPRSYVPDHTPIEAKMAGETLHLISPTEPGTNIQKETRVTLASQGSAVHVEHRLTNQGVWPVTLAPWALTIVANGGYVVLPQEPFLSHDDELMPARPVVIWPFTAMGDPRWRWGTKYISLTQGETFGQPQKVGVYNAQGWAAHVTPSQVFVTQIKPAPGGPSVLPDMGSNFETYTDGPFQELETLAPLQTLEPGQTAEHHEWWYLVSATGINDDDASLDERLLPLIAEAQAAAKAAFS